MSVHECTDCSVHRHVCNECGNLVAMRADGQLRPHYRGGRIQYPNERRCPGGFDPPAGKVLPVREEVVRPATVPVSQGEKSVRTVPAGLPSLGRSRH